MAGSTEDGRWVALPRHPHHRPRKRLMKTKKTNPAFDFIETSLSAVLDCVKEFVDQYPCISSVLLVAFTVASVGFILWIEYR